MPFRDDLFETITRTIQEVLEAKGLPPRAIDPSTKIDSSLGLESLDWAAVAVELEERVGVDPFANGVDTELNTIDDLVALYGEAAG